MVSEHTADEFPRSVRPAPSLIHVFSSRPGMQREYVDTPRVVGQNNRGYGESLPARKPNIDVDAPPRPPWPAGNPRSIESP